MSAAEIRRLVDLGLSAEQLAAVAEMIAGRDNATEERRRRDRERKRPGNSTEIPRKVGGNSTEIPEPPSPPSSLSPKPPIPPAPTPEHTPRVHEGSPEVPEIPEFPETKTAKPPKFPIPPDIATGLQGLFRRKASTPWSEKEIAAARKLLIHIPESQLLADLKLFADVRAAGWTFYRRDMITLLNNWQAEVERSEDYMRCEAGGQRQQPARSSPPPMAPLKPGKWALHEEHQAAS